MTRRESLCLGAAVALHAAALAWQPWLPPTVAIQRDAGRQAPTITVTLPQSVLSVAGAVPALQNSSLTPPKPLVDKPLKPAPHKEPPAPTVSVQSSNEVSGPPADVSTPATPAAHVRTAAEMLAATPVKVSTAATASAALDTARPDHAHNPPLDYPALARRFGVSGRVLVRVLVEASGEAREVLIAGSSGHEVLDQAALKSVRSWRFLPARRGTDTFAAWVEFPVKFELTN